MSTEESRLTQIGESYMRFATNKSKKKTRFALYKCLCGEEKEIQVSDVLRNKIKSFGCLVILLRSTHGLTKHRLYNTWSLIKNRCNNADNTRYKDYGGRGISVCERWNNIENFIEDMYPSFEEGLTLDRINPNGNYEPSNCSWANALTQARNKRKLKSTNTSGYKGVSLNKNQKLWFAQISVNYIHIYLGLYNSPLEAAKAYDTYVIKNNLEHTINGVLYSNIIPI